MDKIEPLSLWQHKDANSTIYEVIGLANCTETSDHICGVVFRVGNELQFWPLDEWKMKMTKYKL